MSGEISGGRPMTRVEFTFTVSRKVSVTVDIPSYSGSALYAAMDGAYEKLGLHPDDTAVLANWHVIDGLRPIGEIVAPIVERAL